MCAGFLGAFNARLFSSGRSKMHLDPAPRRPKHKGVHFSTFRQKPYSKFDEILGRNKIKPSSDTGKKKNEDEKV